MRSEGQETKGASDEKRQQRRSGRPAQRKGKARRRRLRARPVPKWLKTREDLDGIARRRVLMVLSVLSGERAVTEVIAEESVSRGTYYQLEDKALRAMLVALSPGSGPEGTEASALEAAKGRVSELEERIRRLEQDKRRTERLLYVTRKVVKPGPVTVHEGRRRKRRASRASTKSGSGPSSGSGSSRTQAASTAKGTPGVGAASGATPWTPTRGGEAGR